MQEIKIKPKDADDAAEIARMAFALGLPQQYTASVGDDDHIGARQRQEAQSTAPGNCN